LAALQTTMFFLNDRGLELYREAGFSEDDIEFALNQEHELTEGKPLIAGIIERLNQVLEEQDRSSRPAEEAEERSQQFGALFKADRYADAATIRAALFQEKFRFELPGADPAGEQGGGVLAQKKGKPQKRSIVSHILEQYAGSRLYFGLISNFRIGFYHVDVSGPGSDGLTAPLSDEQSLQQSRAFAATIDPFLPLLIGAPDQTPDADLICRALDSLARPLADQHSMMDRARFAISAVSARLRGQEGPVLRPTDWRPIGPVAAGLAELEGATQSDTDAISSCVAEITRDFKPAVSAEHPTLDTYAKEGLTGFVIYKSQNENEMSSACSIASFEASADEQPPGVYVPNGRDSAIAFTGLRGNIEGTPLVGALQEGPSFGARLRAMPLQASDAPGSRSFEPFALSLRTRSATIGEGGKRSPENAGHDVVARPRGETDNGLPVSDPLSQNRSIFQLEGNETVAYQTVSVRVPDAEAPETTATASNNMCVELLVSDERGDVDRRGVYLQQGDELEFELTVKGGSDLKLMAASRSDLSLKVAPDVEISETPFRDYPPEIGAFKSSEVDALADLIDIENSSKYASSVGADQQTFVAFEVSDLIPLNVELSDLSSDIDIELFQVTDQTALNLVASSTNGGADSELMSLILNPGTYLVRVYSYSGPSGFVLTLAADTNDLVPMGPFSESFADDQSLGRMASGDSKIYVVEFETAGRANFRLGGLEADVDIFVRDNGGNALRSGENVEELPEIVELIVEPGTYFVELKSFAAPSDYRLDIAFSSE
ncbi:MAG: PPC domain-containing protein, partial [Pseudomonadota bacterium]